MWTFDNFPIARANATLGTNIDQAWLDRVRLSSVRVRRLFGGHRLGRGPGDDQQPLRRHLRRQSVDPGGQLRRDRLHARAPARKSCKCPGGTAEVLTDIADVTERMHAAGAGLEGQAFTQARDAEAGRIEQEACGGATGQALPGGQPVPGRPVQALHLQEIHRRPPGLRARGSGRDLRRRSGQLQLPALRHRCGLHPPVRERRPGRDADPLRLERRPAGRGHAGVRHRQPRRDPAAADPGPADDRCATWSCRWTS